MAIDFNTLGKNLAPKVRNTSQNIAKNAPTSEIATPNTEAKVADKVKLSSQAQELYQTQGQQSAAQDINQDRVAALAQQIEEGSYTINYQQLASKMLSFERLV